MDSLVATYASSSDEEEDEDQQQQQQSIKSKLFSSLPPPSSDSAPSASSLFSKLPQPKSQISDPFSLNLKPKKVVQFRPPVITKVLDDDADDDKKEEINKDDYIPQAPSVKSFLSSIPAPRNSGSLGAGSSSAGVGRRSILEAHVPGLSNSNTNVADNQVKDENNNLNLYDNSYNEYANASADYTVNNGGYQNVETDYSGYAPASDDQGGYSEYGNYGQYESKWIDRSGGNVEPQVPLAHRPLGKRGRSEIPLEVIEVNQDELMKNRPRPDQAKLTGIAFGPSYQPTSSTKGKPSKLHKRKHQIGSLYFDMRSKEAELAERRSKGFLTKAETQAKYGW